MDIRRALSDKSVLLDAAIALAQMQISAQGTDDAGADGRTTGLVGLNGALVAADVAAKEVLGVFWWASLIVLAASTFILLVTLFGKDRNGVDVGVRAALFYETEGAEPAIPARELLLAELNKAFEFNIGRIARKRKRLQRALGVLLGGLAVAGLLITVDRPTTMKSWSRKPCSSLSRNFRTPGRRANSSRSRTDCVPTRRGA